MFKKLGFIAIYISLVGLSVFSAQKGGELLSFEKYNLSSKKVSRIELPKINLSFELKENKKIIKKEVKKIAVRKETIRKVEELVAEDVVSLSFSAIEKEYEIESVDMQIQTDDEKTTYNQKVIELEEVSDPNSNIEITKVYAINIEEVEVTSLLALYKEDWLKLKDVYVADAPKIPSPEEFKNDEDLSEILAKTKQKNNIKNENDEIVFFDYDAPEVLKKRAEVKLKEEALANLSDETLKEFENIKKVNTGNTNPESNLSQIVNVKLSSNVQKVINREMNQATESRQTYNSPAVTDNDESRSSFVGDNAAITVQEVKFGSGAQGKVYNYQMIPSYNKNETFYSDTDGVMSIQNENYKTGSLITGTLIKRNYVRTRVNIHMDTHGIVVPMFAHEELQKYLDKNELEGYGGFLLVNTMDNIDDLDIDNRYEHRVFLNSKFEVVSRDNEYSFIMFMGVEPGNSTVSGITLDGEQFNKIILITPDEITYDEVKLVGSSVEDIKLWQFQTMASVLSELDIEGKEASYFNTKNFVEKRNINTYSTKVPVRDISMRKYHELTHMESSIFIGHNEVSEIEIPSAEFITEILETFGQSSLDRNCLVQVNFSDVIKNVQIESETQYGANNIENLFLDSDGRMGIEANPSSKKLFISGMDQGIVSMKISYINGKSEVVKSFCSPGTYLVEQL
mgnify:CR=1 FL=1|tara:strand:- start:97983 stop:100025 length:2043 start_codon:yes stop_codon:yes gene_type:complete